VNKKTTLSFDTTTESQLVGHAGFSYSSRRRFLLSAHLLALMLLLPLLLSVVLGVTSHSEIEARETISHSSSGPVSANQPAAPDVLAAPGVVLLGLKPEASLEAPDSTGATLQDTLQKLGIVETNLLFSVSAENSLADASKADFAVGSVYRLRLDNAQDVETVVWVLSAHPAVAYAELDYVALSTTTPNDPLYGQQWGLAKINAAAAWNVTTGSTSVVVAVIDAGLDVDHPDLAGQLWINPGEIPGNGQDDDNNGYVDDIHGWNFVDNNPDLSDNTGHGTEVAGVLAARGNNGTGIAGMCWNCRLMVLKVTQPGGVANYSDIAAAVNYAAQKGAQVINISLGGHHDSATLRTAIAEAATTAVIVAGAGNSNSSAPFYPAAYSDRVLAVAGSSDSDAKVGNSNYGVWISVSAPGEDITTTFDGGSYGAASGTSVAAPFVSGLAGLLRSQYPEWPPATVRAHIRQTSQNIDDLNPGYETMLGQGRIHAGQALSTAAQPLLTMQGYAVDGEASGRPEPGSTVDLAVNLGNLWGPASNVQANLTSSSPYVTINTGTAVYGSVATYATAGSATPFRFTVSAAAPYGHDLAFTLQVTAAGGYTANLPLTVTTVPAVVYPPATITTQTWTNDRIYIINKLTGIPEGHTLTIEPGTVIRFDGSYSLNVNGTLVADGTPEQPIRFTSFKQAPGAGDWLYILFSNTSTSATFDESGNYIAGSILRHTIIEYGHGVQSSQAAPFISHNTFQHLGGTGVYAADSDGIVIADNLLNGSPLYVQGTGVIRNNIVSEVEGAGISASGLVTVTANRVTSSNQGIVMYGGFASQNLLAYNDFGLRVETAVIVSNTIVFNHDSGVYIAGGQPPPIVHQNNLVAGSGGYALYNATNNNIDATSNWWGTASASEIEAGIYDGADQFGLGLVDYSNYLTGPAPDAPAYLQNLAVSPDATLGIQTGTFDLTFSRAMDESIDPQVHFSLADPWLHLSTSPFLYSIVAIAIEENGDKWFGSWYGGVARYANGAWTSYTPSNSGLPGDDYTHVVTIAIDRNGWKWFGTRQASVGGDDSGNGIASFDGNTWIVYDTSNSGLPSDHVYTIVVDEDNGKWIGTRDGGVAHFAGGNWTVYDTTNSPLPYDDVQHIAIDHDGNKWFGGEHSGLARFDGNSWTVYNSSNSGLISDQVNAIAIDVDGSKWIATPEGVLRFDGATWMLFNTENSPLASNFIRAIAIDKHGQKWVGAAHYLYRFNGQSWMAYNIEDAGAADSASSRLAVEDNGAVWIGTNGSAVVAFYGDINWHIANNAQWLNERQWRATFDITSLIQRGEQRIEVSGARDSSGVEIAADKRHNFTVDYAGEITDQTPPSPPWVWTWGVENEPTTVQAMWSATDPESAIIRYRYAIGATAGGTDIINWTTTSGASVTRTGLGLVEGQQYWFSVQAQNSGGLWSSSGQSSFIAGQPINQVYLPLIQR
jgi:subtilisin family serine protease